MAPLDEAALLEFQSRLADVVLWCAPKSPAWSARLRSPQLKPDLPDMPSFAELKAATAFLADQRRRILKDRRVVETWSSCTGEGKLLLCAFNQSISSGESEAQTNGFFDVDDRPPWDTWLSCVSQLSGVSEESHAEHDPILIAWVPGELLSSVNAGINVNPYDCIYWASSIDDELTRQLRTRGLLF